MVATGCDRPLPVYELFVDVRARVWDQFKNEEVHPMNELELFEQAVGPDYNLNDMQLALDTEVRALTVPTALTLLYLSEPLLYLQPLLYSTSF
eukprot:9502803-Pyramimonas_sp.AAC.2